MKILCVYALASAAAFAQLDLARIDGAVTQFTFGNAPRNVGQGPGRVNFDISAHRQFTIRERASLQFRLELFNAFNHPQFGDPNGVIGTSLAGVISSTIVDQRQIQLGLRLAW